MFPRLSRPVIPGIFCLYWEDRAFTLKVLEDKEEFEFEFEFELLLFFELDLVWKLLLFMWFDLE